MASLFYIHFIATNQLKTTPIIMATPTLNHEFAQDILEGLRTVPKAIPSRYFYDERGDRIFQQIMAMPTYYLTNCEHEILEKEKETILELIGGAKKPFQLIELGAGDGTKTKVLLEHFLQKQLDFEYLPIDISEHALSLLTHDLHTNFPELAVRPTQGEYFEALHNLAQNSDVRKVILFLGANIGNFNTEQALDFLKKIAETLQKDDILLIGFDLKKDPATILAAYNDKEGITKSFNLNLLERINRELGGNFNRDHFEHYPLYNPETGEMKSYLISTKEQEVFIEALDQDFHFNAWETIHVEVSKKFEIAQINAMAEKAGFHMIGNLFDSRRYFVDSIWQK